MNVWVPAKDTGVDLLISDAANKRAVSLQVKFSRDFLVTNKSPDVQEPSRVLGWFTPNRNKIVNSPADYWVFVIRGFANRSTDFMIIKPAVLRKRLDAIHGKLEKFHCYFWVTKKARCWETRGLRLPGQKLIAEGQFKDQKRDFTAYLNNWEPIKELNR